MASTATLLLAEAVERIGKPLTVGRILPMQKSSPIFDGQYAAQTFGLISITRRY
jgi:hypothetical protein